MNPDMSLKEKYPDLLGESADLQLARLVADLDTIATASIPPDHLALSIERSLSERARMPQQPTKRTSWTQRAGLLRGLPQRLGLAGTLALLVLSALTITGAAYAVVPMLNSVFHLEEGLQHIDESRLGQEVNVSQTFNGWTINVERVYADANRIVVGYTTTGPKGDSPSNAYCSARDSVSGQEFPSITGVGNGDGISTQASASSFDLGGLANPPDMLNLSLSCAVSVITPDEGEQASPKPSSGESSSKQSQAKRANSEQVAGPFNFTFSVPVIPARIAEIGQTVKVNGYAVTLDRVIVAPSVTRAVLHYKSLDDHAISESAPIIELRVNDRPLGTGAMTGSKSLGGGSVQHFVFAPLYDEQGAWSLTVSEIVIWPDIEQGSSDQTRVSGPWAFNFTLPSAAQH